MPDLRAAILARLDQLEHFARSAKHMDGDRWERRESTTGSVVWRIGVDVNDADYEMHEISQPLARMTTAHIAAWDPRAVLTLCVGARQLVELHAPTFEGSQTGQSYCSGCGGPPDSCQTIRATARMLGLDPDGDT